MDLYDDLHTKQHSGQIDGWSAGIKMLQTQLAIKKATTKSQVLTPVINLKAKKDLEETNSPRRPPSEAAFKLAKVQTTTTTVAVVPASGARVKDNDWDVVDEYDPLWPNEYEKLVKDKRDKENEKRDSRSKDDRDRKRRSSRFAGASTSNTSAPVSEGSPPTPKYSGFGSRVSEEDSYEVRSPTSSSTAPRGGGAAIAPPPSLQEDILLNSNGSLESSSNVTIPYGASSVAAKIMAKYGFKDGQGLGKQEQGMLMALQVEKTSKRGGRIIHEKELIMPPPPPAAPSPPMAPPPAIADSAPKIEPTITEIMKSPSKVVLLRNMVGPGDVDNELEPEVKDECNTKYGEVISVIIHEVAGVVPEDAVRIFVEFKRIESAIKAVVDLNGRFFGGRQVRAGFYNFDRFKTLQLTE